MKTQKKDKYPNGNRSGPKSQPAANKKILQVDFERYAHLLDDSTWDDSEKHEFLETLWSIIVEFVALGWGVHPLQQPQNNCGEISKNLADTVFEPEDMVEYMTPTELKQSFAESAEKGGEHDANQDR